MVKLRCVANKLACMSHGESVIGRVHHQHKLVVPKRWCVTCC